MESGDAGGVTPGSHPRVDTVAQVRTIIKKLIEAADKADGEVKAALVEKGYEHLRNLSEIVVEHEMLKGVVQRSAPNVMMTKLEQINVDTLKDGMAAVTPVFDKCCRYISRPIRNRLRPRVSGQQ